MKQYLDLLRDVRINGVLKPTRAVLKSTGKTVDALSVFGRQMRFDLREGFPLVTTKLTSFNAIVHELIWFLSGSTNVKYLQDHGVKIWNEWAREDGEVGPSYGHAWRKFGANAENPGIDQIHELVENIKIVRDNPWASVGRRLILTAWDPITVDGAALPPCHCFLVFNVTEGRLSCMLTQRSADCAIGVPYNIASYALLTHVLAHVAGLEAGEFVHCIGDAHIYCNLIEIADEQLTREPLSLPRLVLSPSLTDIDEIEFSQISLENYTSHPKLRGEVAV